MFSRHTALFTLNVLSRVSSSASLPAFQLRRAWEVSGRLLPLPQGLLGHGLHTKQGF